MCFLGIEKEDAVTGTLILYTYFHIYRDAALGKVLFSFRQLSVYC